MNTPVSASLTTIAGVWPLLKNSLAIFSRSWIVVKLTWQFTPHCGESSACANRIDNAAKVIINTIVCEFPEPSGPSGHLDDGDQRRTN